MSNISSPNHSHGSASTEVAKERSLSVNAIQRSRRSSRRDSVLPLCMSRDQHAALHVMPSPTHSGSKQRRQRLSSVSSAKNRHIVLPAITAATGQPGGGANGWTALLANPDANPEVARALQMCSLYPTLRVAGTAFENSLNMAHRMSVETFTLLSSSRRGTEVNNGSFSVPHREDAPQTPRMSTSVLLEASSVLREATEDWRAFHDGGNGGGHGRNSVVAANAAEAATRNMVMSGGTKMVQMACAMKRAAMWEVVVVSALAHRAMELKFRRDRLRRVLERHLLPTLLHRKKVTGSVVANGARSSAVQRRAHRDTNDGTSSGGGGAVESGSAPQGSYLREHDAFFASLNNSTLLQSFAETMSRHRFLPGEVIARAGQLSQRSMYFLISGKCEVTKERGDVDGGGGASGDYGEEAALLDGATGTGNGRGTSETPTYRDGMHSSKAPRGRAIARDSTAVSRCQKEVLLTGTTFGGIFGGSAVFGGTYRALSQCIVWELRADDFEQVFRPFSDRVMLDEYKEAMRAHSLSWLQQRYPPAKVFGAIPVYRRLASRKARYLGDFTAVAMTRGELLFAQDHAAGDVYCLLEGTVLRRASGAGGSGDGVAQRLSTNAFASYRAAGRFLLLGEEPHILPGVQPYSCTVSSRVALFYRIPGERFVSALLDDPTLYAQLRERLTKQRQASMVLHPECLAYVPLLRRFPPEKRAELVQYAQPRVLGRSTSLCEPAQHLAELMLVVTGDVCDPRRFGQRPTASLRMPASGDSEVSAEDGSANGGGGLGGGGRGGKPGDKRRHEAATTLSTTAMTDGDPNNSSFGAGRRGMGGGGGDGGGGSRHGSIAVRNGVSLLSGGGGGNAGRDDSDDDDGSPHHHYHHHRGGAAADRAGVEWNFSVSESPLLAATLNVSSPTSPAPAAISFHAATSASESATFASTQRGHGGASAALAATPAQQHQKLCQSAPLVYPDESEELNPPPPVQPCRSFLYALGGSWEALLLDKWPNGWEATSTVALWAIPTYRLRLAYNSCSKAAQSYILSKLRVAQREDQHLSSTPHTKLPPMTVYTQRVEARTAAATGGSATATVSGDSKSQASRRSSFYRKAPRKQGQQQQQKAFGAPSESTASFYRGGDAPAGAAEGAVGRLSDDPLGGKSGKGQQIAKVSSPASSGGGGGGGVAKAAANTAPGAGKQHTSSPSPQRNGATAPATTSAKAKSAHTTTTTAAADASPTTGRKAAAGQEGGGASDRSPPRGVGSTRRRLHKLAASSSAPAPISIDPAVKAAYDGVLDAADPLMLRIVRDPVLASTPGVMTRGGKTPAQRQPAGRNLPPLPGSPLPTTAATGASSTAWPAQAPAQDRWFQAVPSYEPLPGTVRAADTLAAPPVFAPNSTVLASAGMGVSEVHSKTLENHVAYYAATLSPSVAGTLRDVRDGASPHPLPKRRAYAS